MGEGRGGEGAIEEGRRTGRKGRGEEGREGREGRKGRGGIIHPSTFFLIRSLALS